MKKVLQTVLFLTAIVLSSCLSLSSGKTIPVKESVIVLPASPTPSQLAAADELETHLALITGRKPERIAEGGDAKERFAFHVGVTPPEEKNAVFEGNEARWLVDERGAYFYGDQGKDRRGVFFAVDEFLMKACGVRWIEPGDAGIVYQEKKVLELPVSSGRWVPALEFENIRPGGRPSDTPLPDYLKPFQEFNTPIAERIRQSDDVRFWLRQHLRTGGLKHPGYGHAFVKWWDLYSKTNPEYFALNKYGQREPELYDDPKGKKPEWSARDKMFVKICPSNEGVSEQILGNWKKAGMPQKINVCMNDMNFGFCRCEKCMELDGHKPEDFSNTHVRGVTDRYVYLANKIAREARRLRPDAEVVMYAYDEALIPPRFQKVEENVLVGIVPTSLDLADIGNLFDGWRKAGTRKFAMRPNFHTVVATYILPSGIEKHMLDIFQVAYKAGGRATDYDSLTSFRRPNGIMDYVLARSFMNPEKSFSELEAEYCDSFGNAAPEMRDYFRYWRENVFEKKIRPHLKEILAAGKADNYNRGLCWNLGKYYSEKDFDEADAILKKAAAIPNDPRSAERIRQFILANEHARLTFRAIVAADGAKLGAARKLMDFRTANKDKMTGLNWIGIFWFEILAGDITGVKMASDFKDYADAVPTPAMWNFKLDPKDEGRAGKWFESPSGIYGKWESIPTGDFWENTKKETVSPDLFGKIRDYNGIAWYAAALKIPPAFKGKKVFLYFGAVDEACWIYVNGKEAGKHLFLRKYDWKVPFEIEITSFIDWSKAKQDVVVRVEDKGGVGGLWRRVWLVTK